MESGSERNLKGEISNQARTYQSVGQDDVDSRVYWTDGGGVLDVFETTEVEGMKLLQTRKDNSARRQDHQSRRSAGHRGLAGGRQEA